MRYKSFFENSVDAMLIIEDGEFVECNHAALSMLGYGRKEEILHQPPARLSPELQPDGRASVEKAEEMIRLAGERGSFRFEWEHLRKDGSVFPVEVSLTAIKGGKNTQFQTIWRDISERKQAEEALLRSEERFRNIAESMSDWIWEVDAEGVYTYASSKVGELLGYRKDESVGKTPFDFMPPGEAERVGNLFRGFVREKRAFRDLENWNLTQDGRLLCLLTSGVPVLASDGTLLGYRGVDTDITARKQAEEEKERLTAAIDQVAESVVITDFEGTIQYVNPACERITGYVWDEAIGRNPRIFQSGEQDAAFYRAMWKMLAAGETWAGRLSNRRKDGTLYIEEATISPVKDASGKIANYVAIKADITNELAQEERLRQSQKMESIGRLAGGVAHDFNNILQTITGFCGLLLAEMEPRSAQRQDVLEIQAAVRHAGALTQQLLAFSRKQPAEYKELELNAVFSGAEKMLCQALDKSIQLKFELAPGLKPVKADATQLLQMAINLAVNARDAMPDGGSITICTHHLEIQEKDLPDCPGSKIGNWICFSVADTGCGMDEKQMAHLFDPFYTTKQPGKGTGLGLSVVYGIVEEHGGWIHVESESGKGSVFRICLPVHDIAEAGDGSTDHDAFLGKRILLVEDDPVVRELAVDLLQDAGYAVSVAEDAGKAEQLFSEKSGAFDMLFSAAILPEGKSGIELAGVLREQHPELPVLLFSGHSDGRTHVDLIKEKGFNYIRKPFNLKRLLDAVDRTITGVGTPGGKERQ